MKPRRRVEKREYWTCANPEHRHSKPDTAMRCIAKAEREREFSFAECAEIQQQRLAGKGYRELGRQFGISAARAKNVFLDWYDWLDEMAFKNPRRTPQLRWEHYAIQQHGEWILNLVRPDATGRFACQCRVVPSPTRPRTANYWRALRKDSYAFRYGAQAALDKPGNLGNG